MDSEGDGWEEKKELGFLMVRFERIEEEEEEDPPLCFDSRSRFEENEKRKGEEVGDWLLASLVSLPQNKPNMQQSTLPRQNGVSISREL